MMTDMLPWFLISLSLLSHCSAVFTTEEGVTCTTQLSTVKIAFEDIFQPVAMIHFEKVQIFIKQYLGGYIIFIS